MRRTLIVALLLLAVAAGACLLRDGGLGSGVPAGTEAVRVDRVVDGDTVRVLRDGESVPVRLLEVDTPEIGDHGETEECGGPEASDWLADRLPPGTTVAMEADRSDVDRYGRLLRYLWTADGELLNETLVREGLAVAVLYEPDDRHIDRLRAAEAEAREAERGLWGAALPDQPSVSTSSTAVTWTG